MTPSLSLGDRRRKTPYPVDPTEKGEVGKKSWLLFLYPQSRITARVRGISTPANCSNGP